MVRFNSSRNGKKAKKAIRKLATPVSVKQNKPKIVFDTSFLNGRFNFSIFLVFLFLGCLVARAAYVQSIQGKRINVRCVKMKLFQCAVQC